MQLAECNRWRAWTRRTAWPLVVAALVIGVGSLGRTDAPADKRLYERIDALIDAGQIGPATTPASDAEFLRRVYLDLVGEIPTSAEARAFLDDRAADKRIRLVDRLLTSPEHARHLATTLDVMLMERRPAKGVAEAEWRKYLFDSMLANKPFDQLVRELLTADGSDAATRPAANFLLARDAEPNVVTRDVGRVLFGRNLQCCQCHDHPLVDDYYQAEYYGIYALVSRTFVFVDKKDKDKQYLAEKAEGDATFVSVFDKAKIQRTAQPSVPLGQPIAEQPLAKGEEYVVKPADNVRPVPKVSRRAELAKAATENNPAFRRNIVNRLWAMLFGQGLVHPVDMQHRGNIAANEAVLDLLADEFATHKYDMRWLIGELAKTRAYQRSIDLPAELAAKSADFAGRIAADEAERDNLVAAAAASKEAMTKADGNVDAAKVEVIALGGEHTAAQTAATAVKKPADDAAAALAMADKDFAAKNDAAGPLAQAAAKAAEAAAKLKDQKDVVDAAAALKAASDRQAAAVAAAQKILDERKAAAKTAGDALAAANQKLADVTTKVNQATAKVDELIARFREATAKWQLDDAAADRVAARAADAKAAVNYVQSSEPIAAAETNYAKAAGEAEAAKAKVQAAEANVAAMSAAVAEADKALQAARDAEKQIAAAIGELQTTATALAEAFAKTDAARQRLPNDAELADATAKLKARADQAAAAVTAEQPKLAAAQAATKAAADRHTQATAAMQAAAKDAEPLKQSAAESTNRATAAAVARDTLVESRAALAGDLATRLGRRLAVANVRSLSPEQLAWSMMQASGVTANQRTAEIAAWDKANPAADAAAASSPDRIAARERAIEQTTFDKLAGNVGPFIPLFAAAAGQPQDDFYATADQALFFANGGHMRGWLNPGGENLTARLLKITDARPLSDELYLSVLTRRPGDAEVAEVEKYLATRPNDRPAAVQEIAWSLMTSAEFRFNH